MDDPGEILDYEWTTVPIDDEIISGSWIATENEIISGSWAAVRRRLSADDASRYFRADIASDDGVTLFHRLCAKNDAPPDLVHKVIKMDEAFLTAQSRQTFATALHYAAETGSASTIKILLDEMCKEAPWNEIVDSKDYSNTDGCRRWESKKGDMIISPGSNMWLDKKGFTALDILWKRRLIPGDRFYDGERNDATYVRDFIMRMAKITCYGDMTAEVKDLWEKTECFMNAAWVGSTGGGHASPRDEQWPIVHEIVRRGMIEEISFPREVLWLAMKLYPDQVAARDKNGDLPLHIALKKSYFVKHWGAWDSGCYMWNEPIRPICEESNSHEEVGLLLSRFREAATMADGSGRIALHILCENMPLKQWLSLSLETLQEFLMASDKAPLTPNSEGQLPSHVLCKRLGELFSRCEHHVGDKAAKRFVGLLDSGAEDDNCDCMDEILVEEIITWSREAAMTRNQEGRLPLHVLLDGGTPVKQKYESGFYHVVPDTSMVDALVKLAPDALDVPDAESGLFPFMMAATGNNAAVDCIYNLLRKSPAIVSSGIVRNIYGQPQAERNDVVKECNHLSSGTLSLRSEVVTTQEPDEKRRKVGN